LEEEVLNNAVSWMMGVRMSGMGGGGGAGVEVVAWDGIKGGGFTWK
jgi:hypothetical protein